MIDNIQQNCKCRLYGKKDETINLLGDMLFDSYA